MIQSMTGFGKAEDTFGEMNIKVEIRSLNGKQFDLRFRPPSNLKPFEIKIRKILQEQLHRGSAELSIQVTQNGATQAMKINTSLAKDYFHSIQELSKELNLPQKDILQSLLNLPEVVVPSSEELSSDAWIHIKKTLLAAINDLNQHRKDEGKALEADLLSHIENIEKLQENIKIIAPKRKEKIKNRLEQALEDKINKEKIDENRLEQELVYYIEKLDISEEQVRLANHCQYFHEILKENDIKKGKKLNFLLQEIGREINTTGAKANDAELQRNVVKMKDELDKAKEQIMNVL